MKYGLSLFLLLVISVIGTGWSIKARTERPHLLISEKKGFCLRHLRDLHIVEEMRMVEAIRGYWAVKGWRLNCSQCSTHINWRENFHATTKSTRWSKFGEPTDWVEINNEGKTVRESHSQ